MLFLFIDDNDSDQTRVLLTSAAFVHLKHSDFSKHTRNLTPASRTVLLSGPAGMLAGLCDLNLQLDIIFLIPFDGLTCLLVALLLFLLIF